MKQLLLLCIPLIIASITLHGQTTVNLVSTADNTLYESQTGALSNGAGQHMFAGKTNQDLLRRAVFRFNVAGTVPAGATITGATLTLHMSQTISGGQTMNLHRLTANWGEGTSQATGMEGTGASSTNNDATWIHRFWSSQFWTTAGGDFNGTSTAATSVAGTGFYSWSSAQLTTDVQNMLDNPGSDYGWILLGNENVTGSAKRFDTKENNTQANRPKLEITYTMPPQPGLIVINEVDYDQPGTDFSEFIELRNNDNVAHNLQNYIVELVNGLGGGAQVYQTITLPNFTLQPGSYYVICGTLDSVPNCNLVVSPASNLIQNGDPDAIGLRFNPGNILVDAVSYGGNSGAPYTEGSGVGLKDDPAFWHMGISRFPDGADTDVNNVDFTFRCITPGLANQGPSVTLGPSSTVSFCAGSQATLTATGGTNTQWYRNGQPIQGATDTFLVITQGGRYNARLSNGRCTDTAATGIVVLELALPVINLGPDTSVCGHLVLDAGNPGASYLWSTGATTRLINVIQTGTYSVTVTQNTCTASNTVNVTVSQPVVANLPTTVNGCDQAILSGSTFTGASYLWSTGATTQSITVNQSGSYWLRITRGACVSSDTTVVTITTTPTVNAGPDQTVCDSAIIVASYNSPSGTPSVLWSHGPTTQTITVPSPGNYIVTVNLNGCSSNDQVSIFRHQQPQPNLGADRSACLSTVLNPGSFAQYSWSTGATTQTINVIQSGTYRVTVTDINGCVGADTVQITILQALSIDLGPDTASCQSLVLDAGVIGASYNWSTGATTQSINVIQTGTYNVSVSQGGCTSSDTIQVTINPLPVPNLGPDRTACDTAHLSAGTTGAGYLWNTGATTPSIVVVLSSQYRITVTDANGCSGTDSMQLTVVPTPVVSLGPDRGSCGPTILDAGPATSYSWSTGASTQTINVSQTGTYSVMAANGTCQARDTVTITVLVPPVVNLGPDTASCGAYSFTGPSVPGGLYQWSTGATTQSITATQSGSYSLTVTDQPGCKDSDRVELTIYPMPSVSLGNDTTVCDSITLNAGAGWTNIAWTPTPGIPGQFLTINSSSTISLAVTDQNGCEAYDTVTITVLESPSASFSIDSSECPDFAFANLSTGSANSYAWDFDDGSQSTDTDPMHTYTTNGQYTVELEASNTCGTDVHTITISVTCIVGIEKAGLPGWKVYPNPTTDRLFIDMPADGADALVRLMTIDGKQVMAERIRHSTDMQVGHLPGGVYLLVIQSGKATGTYRVVIAR